MLQYNHVTHMYTKEMLIMIGEKIKELRRKEKLSQDELAKGLYVSRQTVSRWENNKTIPNMENIFQISDYFSVTSDYFVSNNIKHSNSDNEISNKIKYKEILTTIAYFFMGIAPFFVVWAVPFSIYAFNFSKIKKVKYNTLIRVIALTSIIFFILQLLIFLVGLFNLSGSTTEVHVN